ncbi:dehydrogenase/reductase SDR family member 7-like isoform X2 [Pecten maximus]|nr:dehydrogenase/reductase SDR family member 7-like isoform X2 [Pecten maximus]XP_033734509.1 dehydrogenase/reductase SDR family member 7-like isoform X2 [Pecten maximus]XP_033734510.1 dehydrogenase/reductase SDR family member 7-like isoform X2 [Pecten maximus]XP_033734511.1 dehydrogenase/reductase SDR family member 7-like isoform X2 [Pecten maximus]
MDWLYFLVGCAVLFLLLQICTLLRSDCDLALIWMKYIGKSPESLKGQVVWVTGASSGIGEALALKLASAGCRLVLSARREDRLQTLKQRCVELGYGTPNDYLVLPLDLLDYDSHKGLVETALKYFKKIDCLVNNAGRSQRAVISKTSFAVDQQMLAVNTLGSISLTKAVLPVFIRQNSGQVVVTSSLAGKIGSPGLASYCASKYALHGWFDCLRVESVMYNIHVTVACPGPVFSEALIHAFTEDPNKNLGLKMQPGEKRMTAARCAHLMALAMANNMDEVWLTANPELSYLYMNQYLPSIFHWLAKRFGQKRLKKILEGIGDLH